MADNGTRREHDVKGVLFDFDGTLTSPGALDFPAIKREMSCPGDMPILEYLDTLSTRHRSRALKILDTKEAQAAEKSSPNRYSEQCLSLLKKNRICLGIITRNSLKSVQVALENFNGVLENDFAAIITRDDAPPKPHPDGVYLAANQMGISPAELLVVGDFRFDVMAGYAAGTGTVLLTNGGKSAMAADDPVPDYTIDSLEDLPGILRIIKDGHRLPSGRGSNHGL